VDVKVDGYVLWWVAPRSVMEWGMDHYRVEEGRERLHGSARSISSSPDVAEGHYEVGSSLKTQKTANCKRLDACTVCALLHLPLAYAYINYP
jgi:hypothetical protein